MRLAVSPKPRRFGFFQIILFELRSIEIGNFSKTLLIKFLSSSKNPAFLLSLLIIFKRTQGTTIPSNFIYFIKKTNEWIVCAIIRTFGDKIMLIWKVK